MGLGSELKKGLKKVTKSVGGVLPFLDPLGLTDALFPDDIEDPGAPPSPVEAERAGIISAAEKNEERRRRLARQGRQSTFATSPAGLTTTANVQRKTLFGQ